MSLNQSVKMLFWQSDQYSWNTLVAHVVESDPAGIKDLFSHCIYSMYSILSSNALLQHIYQVVVMSESIVDDAQYTLEGHCDWLVSKQCTKDYP